MPEPERRTTEPAMAPRRHWLRRPPWRTIVPGVTVLLAVLAGYTLWQPGKRATDGRHDLS